MKLSLNFVKDYIDLDDNLTVNQIAEDMTRSGKCYKFSYWKSFNLRYAS